MLVNIHLDLGAYPWIWRGKPQLFIMHYLEFPLIAQSQDANGAADCETCNSIAGVTKYLWIVMASLDQTLLWKSARVVSTIHP